MLLTVLNLHVGKVLYLVWHQNIYLRWLLLFEYSHYYCPIFCKILTCHTWDICSKVSIIILYWVVTQASCHRRQTKIRPYLRILYIYFIFTIQKSGKIWEILRCSQTLASDGCSPERMKLCRSKGARARHNFRPPMLVDGTTVTKQRTEDDRDWIFLDACNEKTGACVLGLG